MKPTVIEKGTTVKVKSGFPRAGQTGIVISKETVNILNRQMWKIEFDYQGYEYGLYDATALKVL